MLKKAMATAVVAASAAAVSAAAAPQALALGEDSGRAATGGESAPSAFGTGMTSDDVSPRAVLERTAPHAMRVGVPSRADMGSLVGLPSQAAVREAAAPSGVRGPSRAENSPRASGATAAATLSGLRDAVPAAAPGNGAGHDGITR